MHIILNVKLESTVCNNLISIHVIINVVRITEYTFNLPPLLQPSRLNQSLESLKKFAFIVGGAVIIFGAVRNSLTWHLQKFWGASGDFWNRQWVKIHDFYGGDEFVLGVWGKLLPVFYATQIENFIMQTN